MIRTAACLLTFTLAAACVTASPPTGDSQEVRTVQRSTQPSPDQTGGPMAPEPDYRRVTEKEFEAAVAEGSPEALVRFIARHPEDPLADQARSRLYADRGRSGSQWRTSNKSGPDATIYAAFYQAVRRDTADAYDGFIARYKPHPLVEEAQRLKQSLESPR